MRFRPDIHAIVPVLRTATILACCLVVLSACDSDPTNSDDDSIAGTWAGNLPTGSGTQSFSMTLSETETAVGGISISGSGTVTSTTRTVTFQVSGSYVHPILSLEAFYDVPPGTNPIGTISGVVSTSRTQITATMSGPEISGQVVFTRGN